MAPNGPSVDRLREYLRQLPTGARALLIRELERAHLRGDEIPGGEFLLTEVRSAVRDVHDHVPRIGNAERLFFRPVEPFLHDADHFRKFRGRIARPSLEPIWAWICRDVLPEESEAYRETVNRCLAAGDDASAEPAVLAFQDAAATRMRALLASIASDDKARRRLAGQIGAIHALEDVGDLVSILTERDTLTMIVNRLPPQIRNLSDAQLESAKSLLDSPDGLRSDTVVYGLILVKARLANPWQLIRLAIKAAESDATARIAATPYGVTVTVVLDEVEVMVCDLRAGLKRGAGKSVPILLKSIHDAARGLRSELDLAGDSPWARQLVAIRSEVSTILKAEIESLPGRVRRLLRPRAAGEMGGGALEADEVAKTEALIELAGLCRNFASELAINELTLKTYNELQHFLDTGTEALIEGLRHAGAADRGFRQSQVDAAVRFCAKMFGKEYASLLTKAAEVAANSERKAAASAKV